MVLFACFLLSGATALVYEVVCLRMLRLVFGHTVHAVSAVLVAFMAGLALGSALGGRVARSMPRPVRTYAWFEIGIGIWAAALPALFGWSAAIYPVLFHSVGGSYAALPWLQFAVGGALLLLPATLMGATLPLLTQALGTRPDASVGRVVGSLYAANTYGAVIGAAVGGYVLLPALGNRLTLEACAVVNIGLGVAAVLYDRRVSTAKVVTSPSTTSGTKDRPPVWGRGAPIAATLTVLALGVSGAVSMLYEVTWTRALALVLGSSTYAFTGMLVTFLLGLAGGSGLYAWTWGRREASPATLGALQAGIAMLVIPVLFLFDRLPELVLDSVSRSPEAYVWLQLTFSAAALLPVTLLIGATLPCTVAAITRTAARAGEVVGPVYAVNTVGAVAGTLLAGFVLVPALGVRGAIIVGVLTNLLLAAVLLAVSAPRAIWSRVGAASAVVAGVLLVLVGSWASWDRRLMVSGPAIYAVQYVRAAAATSSSVRRELESRQLLFYRDGVSATVSVGQAGPNRYLQINGKTDGSTGLDMLTQHMLGHLPLLLHPAPRDVLVIGLGTGVTAAAVARHDVRRLDVVEIEPAVVEAAQRFFADVNHDVLRDPRTRTVVADGRNVLLTTEARYDVIVSEPSNPWIRGIASLFTREFFELARARLEPGGMMLQWVQLYALPDDDLKMIVKTFQTVFPAMTAWTVGEDLLLLGRMEVGPVDLTRLQSRFATARLAEDLRQAGPQAWPMVLGFFSLDAADVRRFADTADIETDDRLRLEFSAPRGLYLDTVDANHRALRRARTSTLPELLAADRPRLETADAQYWMGVGCLGRRATDEALVRFQRALELQPDHQAALVALGETALRLPRPR